MAHAPALVWFRRDLRLADNAALLDAVASGRPLLPVFIWDAEFAEEGAAGRWWLHGSLGALDRELRARGSGLLLRRGPTAETLLELVAETGARRVSWNRQFSAPGRALEQRLGTALSRLGVEVFEGEGQLLWSPERVANRAGEPFQVFTPFWRHCRTHDIAEVTGDAPARLRPLQKWPSGEALADLRLRPKSAWADGFAESGIPGETNSRRRLDSFVHSAVERYAGDRDVPSLDGTSRLSAALHFGEVTPRSIWATLVAASKDSGVVPGSRGAQVFFDEVGWREFAHHQRWHFPEMDRRALRPQYESFPWRRDGALQRAWREGRTGVPLVDAGMRQLWKTGWMHNRVRMVVASYFVKHLLQPWTDGAAWFMDTLVDADCANNALGWQWSAGCGPDAAPYFRVFNPVLQGEKFDREGAYVRRWVPELAALPAARIHRPWETEPLELEAAGVRLGRDYPWPVIEPAEGRRRALEAYGSWRAQLGKAETGEVRK